MLLDEVDALSAKIDTLTARFDVLICELPEAKTKEERPDNNHTVIGTPSSAPLVMSVLVDAMFSITA